MFIFYGYEKLLTELEKQRLGEILMNKDKETQKAKEEREEQAIDDILLDIMEENARKEREKAEKRKKDNEGVKRRYKIKDNRK